jgi:hypothetical protein
LSDDTRPRIETFEGIDVVRDDLYPGGTKARYAAALWDDAQHCVYATPAQGGAQVALAHTAHRLGKRLTLFVAGRATWHERTRQAAQFDGVTIQAVRPGYLAVVQRRAIDFARINSYRLVPFGMAIPEAVTCLVATARTLQQRYDEVWCASGSGTLARALCRAFPTARVHAVSVGHRLTQADVGSATLHVYGGSFSTRAKVRAPFDCDPTYEEKAWEFCLARRGPAARTLFWNVAAADMSRALVAGRAGP